MKAFVPFFLKMTKLNAKLTQINSNARIGIVISTRQHYSAPSSQNSNANVRTVVSKWQYWTTEFTAMQTLALVFQNDNFRIPKLPLLNETVMQTFTLLHWTDTAAWCTQLIKWCRFTSRNLWLLPLTQPKSGLCSRLLIYSGKNIAAGGALCCLKCVL
jgi:hypothetical protein